MSTAPPHERQRIKVPAREVRAGDWTEFSGHRLVIDVKPLRGQRVGIVRVSGKKDKLPCDLEVVVYRHVET